MPIKYTLNDFIKKSNEVHDYLYDYSLVDYINSKTKVDIICKKHGKFSQIPKDHLQGHGCIECGKVIKRSKLVYNNDSFIKMSLKIHNYDYSLVKYKDSETKIKIICKEHGIFEQKPNNHLQGQGCPKCKNNIQMDKDIFIKKSLNIHKYNYSLVEYKNNKTRVKIICEKHGIFEQRPDMHLQGQGCPSCQKSKGEILIENILNDKKIKYVKQKRFKDCKYLKPLPFDFYLPEYKICIEYDGIQHFEIKKHWGGEEELKNTQKRDKIKNEYCKNNNISLIRIKYSDNILEKMNFLSTDRL